MSATADKITEELAVLVGLPMSDWWRAAGMQILEFGPKHKIVNRRGEEVERSDISLHLQCFWRLVDSERIVFGHEDLDQPADKSIDPSDFDWDKDDSVLDFHLSKWRAQYYDTPPLVVEATGDAYRGISLALDNGHNLQTFPCSTPWNEEEDNEYWRLCGHRKDGRHFVVADIWVEHQGTPENE
jgi:hypothetical protein